jgi:pimeloyl-ACP methyl ester carboxylesterase
VEELRLEANGARFRAVADGPESAPLVLLLHGFPESSRSWRHQLPALAAAGFRAVAPDLRGYGGSDKHGPYDLETLAGDAAGLVASLGRERATVVGHDWGGAVAWGTAHHAPERVERLVVLNCPHPASMRRELLTNPRQLTRSSYMFFFQLPWLPERALTRDGARQIARALRGGSHVREAWPREELDRAREAFLRPGVASAALGYYRAAARRPDIARRLAARHPITAPTLILWGVHDRFLGEETIRPARLRPYFAPGNEPEIRRIEQAGHFVQNEAPERVNEELVDWLTASPSGAR